MRTNRYYADVSQQMLSTDAFIIGSDGDNWWWHMGSGTRDKASLMVCARQDMHQTNICICDPFGLTGQTPEEAAKALELSYVGRARVGETDCHLLERWAIDGSHPEFICSGDLVRWWVDADSGRPVEVGQLGGDYLMRTRFLYDAVNEPPSAQAFAIPKVPGVQSTPPETLDDDYNSRFVNVGDGSDGRMSVRWGKIGPKGRSSSGLN